MIEIILSCGLAILGIICVIQSLKIRETKIELNAAVNAEAMLLSRNAEMQKALTKAKDRPPSVDLQEFLHDMEENNAGYLKVTRADMAGTLLWSAYNGAK